MNILYDNPEPVYTGDTVEYLSVVDPEDEACYVAGLAQADLLGEDGDYLGYSEWSAACEAIADAEDHRRDLDAALTHFRSDLW